MASADTTFSIGLTRPFHASAMLRFLADRAVPGVELVDGRSYWRTLALPGGPGLIRLDFPDDDPAGDGDCYIPVATCLTDPVYETMVADLCRDLLGASIAAADVHATLLRDEHLAHAVEAAPGIRVPGAVDGPETLIRALIGQQISVAAARTKLGQLALLTDERIPAELTARAAARGTVINLPTRLFPSPAALAALTPEQITGPRARADTILAAAADMAAGKLTVTSNRAYDELTTELTARRGIGPWTADYVAMRVLAQPDILLTGDLALRNGAAALDLPSAPKDLAAYGARWSPYRSFAGMYLWRSCPPPTRRHQARVRPTAATYSRRNGTVVT